MKLQGRQELVALLRTRFQVLLGPHHVVDLHLGLLFARCILAPHTSGVFRLPRGLRGARFPPRLLRRRGSEAALLLST